PSDHADGTGSLSPGSLRGGDPLSPEEETASSEPWRLMYRHCQRRNHRAGCYARRISCTGKALALFLLDGRRSHSEGRDIRDAMNPCVRTEIPGPKSREYLELSRKSEPRSMSEQAPIVWDHANGALVTDVDGNVFIDFTSGVLVTNIGHSHPDHVAAIQDQAGDLMNSYDFVTPWRAKLAQKLVDITPPSLDRAFILTTRSE